DLGPRAYFSDPQLSGFRPDTGQVNPGPDSPLLSINKPDSDRDVTDVRFRSALETRADADSMCAAPEDVVSDLEPKHRRASPARRGIGEPLQMKPEQHISPRVVAA